MENKINIAELLKDCPKGMELDCVSYYNVSFDKISDDKKSIYPIFCYITDKEGNRSGISFTKNGCESKRYGAKCVIFPKGKKTWEGFQRPFKDGDVVAVTMIPVGTWIGIFKQYEKESFESYCSISSNGDFRNIGLKNHSLKDVYLATEEEKAKLFDAIKANGYKWNAETKTLEELIEPKFKVGDKVLWNYDTKIIRTISKVQLSKSRGYVYWIDCEGCSSGWWNENELTPIPNNFDITTLKPFESRVLVRNDKSAIWKPAIYGIYKDSLYWMVAVLLGYNASLIRKTNTFLEQQTIVMNFIKLGKK